MSDGLIERMAEFRERNADILHDMEAHDPFPWHPSTNSHHSMRTSVQVRLLPECGGLYVLGPRFGTCRRPECYAKSSHRSSTPTGQES